MAEDAAESGSRKAPQRSKAGQRRTSLAGFFHFIELGRASALPSKSLRYFVAIAATAVAFTASFLLKSDLGDVATLLMFTLSVVVASW